MSGGVGSAGGTVCLGRRKGGGLLVQEGREDGTGGTGLGEWSSSETCACRASNGSIWLKVRDKIGLAVELARGSPTSAHIK